MERKKKNIVIISNFYKETLNSRGYIVYKYFKEAGYTVKVICSDFSHANKNKEIYSSNKDLIIIKTKIYKNNLSLKRIYSHIIFALEALKILKKIESNLVYLILPPNILGFLISKYTKKNKIRLISDIIDLWPEALPIPTKIKKILDMNINIFWKFLRNETLKKSDCIITESNYFYKKMELSKYNNSKVIYLKKILLEEKKIFKIEKNKEEIRIGYLGNIGLIYDFEGLIEILKQLSKIKDVFLEIIGTGERQEFLLRELQNNKINYKFHGVLFNEEKKREILEKCHFGFNGYKKNTEVALSYKTIDYFSYGLPIINSAKGDTWEMIEQYKLGINYSDINLELIKKITEYKSENILEFFQKNFSYKSLILEMEEILKK